MQKLERTGVIIDRVARVDAHKQGLGLTVLAEVTAMDHSAPWREAFLNAVRASPAVMEVLRLGGLSDYLFRVTVPDTPCYDAFYRRFTAAVPLRAVRSSFVMKTVHVKASLRLPDVA